MTILNFDDPALPFLSVPKLLHPDHGALRTGQLALLMDLLGGADLSLNDRIAAEDLADRNFRAMNGGIDTYQLPEFLLRVPMPLSPIIDDQFFLGGAHNKVEVNGARINDKWEIEFFSHLDSYFMARLLVAHSRVHHDAAYRALLLLHAWRPTAKWETQLGLGSDQNRVMAGLLLPWPLGPHQVVSAYGLPVSKK